MGDRFREVEETFALLRRKFHERTISKREYIDTLKQLRIKDDEGRFWMIGAQTGQWYCHDGGGWSQAKPPSLLEHKAICISCGFENDLETEFCSRCGSRPGVIEPAPPPASGRGDVALPVPGPRDLVVRSCHIGSFFWFFGAMGLFAGMLAGLTIGVTNLFPGLVAGLPGFFADIQGKLPGGLVFTVLGGVAGFVLFGAGGALTAFVANGVMSLVGGIRLQADEASAEGPEKSRD